MVNKEGSTEIVNFMTPGALGLVSGRGHTFKNFFSTLEDGSDKHKKTVLIMCLLIPIAKSGYIAAFICHC